MEMGEAIEDLISSRLGTKDYWVEAYKEDLGNFHDHGDIGEIWFGKASVDRVTKWLIAANVSKTDAVLDIGCGNGVMLIELAKLGFKDLTGIDYVEDAIDLAKTIAANKGATINFEVIDFLQQISSLPSSSCLHQKYKILIDKGTYDAVSLSPEDSAGKRTIYLTHILHLLESNGILIIVSCNWTKDELLSHFKGFEFLHEILTPVFRFGGGTGSTVTSLVLKKC